MHGNQLSLVTFFNGYLSSLGGVWLSVQIPSYTHMDYRLGFSAIRLNTKTQLETLASPLLLRPQMNIFKNLFVGKSRYVPMTLFLYTGPVWKPSLLT